MRVGARVPGEKQQMPQVERSKNAVRRWTARLTADQRQVACLIGTGDIAVGVWSARVKQNKKNSIGGLPFAVGARPNPLLDVMQRRDERTSSPLSRSRTEVETRVVRPAGAASRLHAPAQVALLETWNKLRGQQSFVSRPLPRRLLYPISTTMRLH